MDIALFFWAGYTLINNKKMFAEIFFIFIEKLIFRNNIFINRKLIFNKYLRHMMNCHIQHFVFFIFSQKISSVTQIPKHGGIMPVKSYNSTEILLPLKKKIK